MMRTSSHPWALRASGPLLLGGLLAVLAAPAAEAAPLRYYTGRSYPGNPAGRARPLGDLDAAPAAVASEEPEIGATIYSGVLERDKAKATPGDTWGTGIPDFDRTFRASLDSRRGGLDTSARYLYLYQVVNSRRQSVLTQASVRLLIDPRLISSWGHFQLTREQDKEKTVLGVGFTVQDEGAKGPVVRPVSTLDAARERARFRNGDPFRPSSKVRGFQEIPLTAGGKAVAAALARDAATIGREPERVLLLAQANFRGVKRPNYRLPVRERDLSVRDRDLLVAERDRNRDRDLDADELAPRGAWQTWSWAVDEQPLESGERWRADHWPAVRAYWLDNPLRPSERSTIFGFTSDYPPVYDYARIGGLRRRAEGVVPAAEGAAVPLEPVVALLAQDAAPAANNAGVPLTANGGIPTPIALPAAAETATTGAFGAAGLPFGGLGGQPLSGGGGGGGFPGGIGGGGLPGGGVGAGGFPGGIGAAGGLSGGGGGTPASGVAASSGTPASAPGAGNPQNQNQTQGTNPPATVNVVNNPNQNPNQSPQFQVQPQSQNQTQNQGPSGNVVPAPPAWLLGVLGLPIFLVLARRRRAAGAAAT